MSHTELAGSQMIDERRTIEQMRASDLREIAWAYNLPCKSTATKAELVPLLEANGIGITRESVQRAVESRNSRLRAHVAELEREGNLDPRCATVERPLAVVHMTKEDALKVEVESAPWFRLQQIAKEHGVDIPPKGEGRAQALRDALKAHLSDG